MSGKFSMDDYIDVPQRIAEFRAKHPEGSLQSSVERWPTTEFPFIVVRAKAFRTPDDPTPGHGWAQELFPGRTPYTKDSELQNAETSAWGRAIVATLAADTKKGIASAEEVRNRRATAGESAYGEGANGSPAVAPSGEGHAPAGSSSPCLHPNAKAVAGQRKTRCPDCKELVEVAA